MKRLFLVLLMCLAAFAAGAQTVSDLTGSWTSHDSDTDEDMEMTADETLTFRKDGSFTQSGYCYAKMRLDEETQFECDFEYSAEGKFTLNADVITYTFTPKSIVIKEGKVEMPNMMKALLFKPLVSEIKKTLKGTRSDRIMSFDGKTLMLLDLKEKDATPDTFTRSK